MGERRSREELFLVQFRSCPPSVGDVVEMHRALHRAVTRLGSAGTAIRWCAAWLLPDDCRCLCLVQAAREADVVRARDLAALSTASVFPARALGGGPPLRTGSRS
ncbi:hypothetical protein SAMN05660350_01897 [Geodermatophilus obscurus]|uniref:Uncharacterized protein n=1 Tax=Geodermatophilus obscurus TaxID=1861 RepID=A0A1M7TLA8_9ACTN|nr:hypothetical protein [Geodermatophilus obscurus]SHN71413.1 hypothetical protein SAMN05660350_01897 [Geodermatophilus obscurus]